MSAGTSAIWRRRLSPLYGRWRLAAVIVALVLAGVLLARAITAPPSEEGAAEIVFGHELLAYEVWEGTPHVVFRLGGRIIFDQLRQDWVSRGVPPLPKWQLTGDWYYVAATDAPASVGVARCPGLLNERCNRDTQVFGEINATGLVVVEIQYDDA